FTERDTAVVGAKLYYPNMTTYHQVEKYSRLVYDHGSDGKTPPLFRVDVKFSEANGKTTMDMRMILATPEAASEIKKFVKKAGGNSTWDRLAEYLAEDQPFVINRSFEAPISVVFDMWTNPAHFSKWLPPAGMKMEFITADIQAGGECFYSMQAEDSSSGTAKIFGKIQYLEVVQPNRLVYTQIFCDEKGALSRHPMAPTWPETMITTVTLAEEDSEETRVTVEWKILGNATAAERDTFQKEKFGMAQGWGSSFDKLEDALAARTK
ncbi:MAG: hypothetical protein EOP06_31440, partial [Proteobacteria bacterium]